MKRRVDIKRKLLVKDTSPFEQSTLFESISMEQAKVELERFNALIDEAKSHKEALRPAGFL